MQMIPLISISAGKPAMLFPLTFVIILSMIKDIFEDYKRHKSDKSENYKRVLVYDPNLRDFTERHWCEIKVGHII